MDLAQKKAIRLIIESQKKVPAYKQFLRENKVKVDANFNVNDFKSLPLTDKKNYLRKYPYRDLFINKKMAPILSMSSGSSGKPFFWLRDIKQEEEGANIHENILKNIFRIQNKRTLVIICFAMGSWIAGTFTMGSCIRLANRGYNITVATPGIEKNDIISVLSDFAPHYEKVILAGYPPLLMDVISEANNKKVSLKRFDLRLLFAGENFSEEWRDNIHEAAGIDKTLTGSVSIYGTADADIQGHETPLRTR